MNEHNIIAMIFENQERATETIEFQEGDAFERLRQLLPPALTPQFMLVNRNPVLRFPGKLVGLFCKITLTHSIELGKKFDHVNCGKRYLGILPYAMLESDGETFEYECSVDDVVRIYAKEKGTVKHLIIKATGSSRKTAIGRLFEHVIDTIIDNGSWRNTEAQDFVDALSRFMSTGSSHKETQQVRTEYYSIGLTTDLITTADIILA